MKGPLGIKLDKSDREAMIAVIAWVACAIGLLSLQDRAEALTFLWLPSAVAVGSIFAAGPRRRPKAVMAIALACMIGNLWYGFGLVASLGYTLANIAEALIVVLVARRVTRGKLLMGLGMFEMASLFGASLAGSIVAVLLSWPFREVNDPLEVAWLVMSMTLGTAVGTPLLLYLRGWLKGMRLRRDCEFANGLTLRFFVTCLALFLLSWFVLGIATVPLTPLVLSGMVFAVWRYGQLGAAAGIFAFALAATLRSLGGQTPAAYLQIPPFEAGLVLQLFMVVMMATSLPLAALLTSRDRLEARLKARNGKLRENLMLLHMAEEIGRIGRWRYYPKTGVQDWSRQMFRINGLDPKLGRDPGDITYLLPDGGKHLFGALSSHSADRAPYTIEYRVRTPRGDERILKMHATNEFDSSGKLKSMFGVVMDVTEHYLRQEALDKERTRAMRLAAEAQYLAHTDALTGLANRRRTIGQLEKCIRRSVQGNRPLALIVFDIDHFKQINDRHGHQVGDEVLVRVADIAREQVRASDLIGRVGGEEFVWLLPDAGLKETRAAAERLRKAIERESCAGGLPQVTASIGFAQWSEGDDAGVLMGKADAALYRAKGAGRNSVREAA